MRSALSRSRGMGIASSEGIKEKLVGRHRPTNIADTGASEERGYDWAPTAKVSAGVLPRSRNDSAHRVIRTALGEEIMRPETKPFHCV